MKKKVIQVIPNFGVGGAESMVENLSYSLTHNEYEVVIVSLYDLQTDITTRLKKNNIKTYYLNKKKGLDIRMIFKLFKIIKKEAPDIIHTHLYSLQYVATASFSLNIPVRIHTVHSLAHKEVSKLQRIIQKYIFKIGGFIPVAITPKVKETILVEYKLDYRQVPVVYNGINLGNCFPKTTYDFDDRINILHIGSFKEAKNHMMIIDSFKYISDKVPNAYLKLIGDGHLKQEVEERVRSLGLQKKVEFLGVKSNVYKYLNQADIFILPSKWEGMPMALIEAMGTGLPIVATKVGGIVDMIENQVTGLLVEVDDFNIAEGVLKLIEDENLRIELGKNAKLKSKEYSANRMAKRYAELYSIDCP